MVFVLIAVVGGFLLFAGRDLKELHQARPRWQRVLLWLLYLAVGLPLLMIALIMNGIVPR